MLQAAARVFSPSGFRSTTFRPKGKRVEARREGERVFLVLSSGAVLFLSAADSVNAFPGKAARSVLKFLMKIIKVCL